MTKNLTIESRVERKREQIARLRDEERQLKTQLRARARRADTRRKILLGSWLLAQAGGDFRALAGRLDRYLVRPADRALFGLPATDDQRGGD